MVYPLLRGSVAIECRLHAGSKGSRKPGASIQAQSRWAVSPNVNERMNLTLIQPMWKRIGIFWIFRYVETSLTVVFVLNSSNIRIPIPRYLPFMITDLSGFVDFGDNICRMRIDFDPRSATEFSYDYLKVRHAALTDRMNMFKIYFTLAYMAINIINILCVADVWTIRNEQLAKITFEFSAKSTSRHKTWKLYLTCISSWLISLRGSLIH